MVGFLFINAWNILMAIDFLLLLSFEIDTLFEFFDNVSQKERRKFLLKEVITLLVDATGQIDKYNRNHKTIWSIWFNETTFDDHSEKEK